MSCLFSCLCCSCRQGTLVAPKEEAVKKLTSINDLPDSLLRHIFSYRGLDREVVRSVCSRWAEVVRSIESIEAFWARYKLEKDICVLMKRMTGFSILENEASIESLWKLAVWVREIFPEFRGEEERLVELCCEPLRLRAELLAISPPLFYGRDSFISEDGVRSWSREAISISESPQPHRIRR